MPDTMVASISTYLEFKYRKLIIYNYRKWPKSPERDQNWYLGVTFSDKHDGDFSLFIHQNTEAGLTPSILKMLNIAFT